MGLWPTRIALEGKIQKCLEEKNLCKCSLNFGQDMKSGKWKLCITCSWINLKHLSFQLYVLSPLCIKLVVTGQCSAINIDFSLSPRKVSFNFFNGGKRWACIRMNGQSIRFYRGTIGRQTKYVRDSLLSKSICSNSRYTKTIVGKDCLITQVCKT